MVKLFVTIYGIMVFQFQKSGKINNIKTLKEVDIQEHKHLKMHNVE